VENERLLSTALLRTLVAHHRPRRCNVSESPIGPHTAIEARRAVIDHWSEALDHGDDVEVERLVCQSRSDRVDAATSGLLGLVLGGTVPLAASGPVS
jgi:hypothetical protein